MPIPLDVTKLLDDAAKPTGEASLSEATALTPAWLTSRAFRFSAGQERRLLSSSLRFEMNGRISGYYHPNESAWRIEDGNVVVLRSDSVPTCVANLTRNNDGTVSLAGEFLLDPEKIIHRFDEIPSNGDLPEIHTFDLFDTLVARRCHEPAAIFRQVEIMSRVTGFARLRQTIESDLFRRGDYNFDDVYRVLGRETGWPAETLRLLQMLELSEEWDNLFPIQEMVGRVRPDDMIVSDMYLPIGFLRCVVDEKCGLRGRVIHLTNHGKHHGTVWPEIQTTHRVLRHHGDNLWSDVKRARQAGIDAEHVAMSAWTRGEEILVGAGLAPFARLIREARLRSFHPDPQLHLAQLAQFNINLPLLIVASLILLRKSQELRVDTLLMCSRDCNLWTYLMRLMATRSSGSPIIRYFVASRVLFLADSPEYMAYFMRMRGQRSMLVDVSGTGRSVKYFLGQVGAQSHASAYILASTPYVANWVADMAQQRDDVEAEFLSEQPYDTRILIEMLNMSLEGRATRVGFTGHNLEIEREPNEFGSNAKSVIAAMRSAFLGAMAIFRHSDIRQIPGNLPIETLRSAGESIISLVDVYRPALSAIRDDIEREEGHIAATARAERQRNSRMVAGNSDHQSPPCSVIS